MLGVRWGGRDSLLFELDSHVTRQRILHRLHTLRAETELRATALLTAAEGAARAALQRACQEAGVRSQMLGGCMLLLPRAGGAARGVQVTLSDPRNIGLAKHLAAWVAARPTDWARLSIDALAGSPPRPTARRGPAPSGGEPSAYQSHVLAAADLQAQMQSHLQAALGPPNARRTWQ